MLDKINDIRARLGTCEQRDADATVLLEIVDGLVEREAKLEREKAMLVEGFNILDEQIGIEIKRNIETEAEFKELKAHIARVFEIYHWKCFNHGNVEGGH